MKYFVLHGSGEAHIEQEVGSHIHGEFSPLPLRVDCDMEMDVVVDDVFAEEAEEFARAVVADANAESGTRNAER